MILTMRPLRPPERIVAPARQGNGFSGISLGATKAILYAARAVSIVMTFDAVALPDSRLVSLAPKASKART
jgi:hypothetical protein